MPTAWQAALRRIDVHLGSDVEDLNVWATPVEAMEATNRWLTDNAVRVTAGWEPHGENGYRLTAPDGQGWAFPHPTRRGAWEAAVSPVQAAAHEIRRDTRRGPVHYAVIDTDGRLHLRTGPWQAELGPDGWDQLILHTECGMTAFVGRYRYEPPPCNVLGSVLLVVFGAAVRPHPGPVILTGWNFEEEVRSLYDPSTLTDIHGTVRRLLGQEEGTSTLGPFMDEQILATAEHIRAAAHGPALPVGGA